MKKLSLFFLITFLLSVNIFPQVVIKTINSSLPKIYANYSNSEKREIVDFNNNWKIKSELESNDSKTISLPASFASENSLFFEKTFTLDTDSTSKSNYFLHFLGISYSADIYLNDVVIYKKPVGNIPFTVELPNNLLNDGSSNKLSIFIKSELDSRTTIPLYQRFLFPQNDGGILRDVFLEIVPFEHFNIVRSSTKLNENLNDAQLNFDFEFLNLNKVQNSNYNISVKVLDNKKRTVYDKNFKINSNTDYKTISFNLKKPKLWSPKHPTRYLVEIKLSKNDSLIDAVLKDIQFSGFENRPDGIFLNGKIFHPIGVTYINSNLDKGTLTNYKQLRNDLEIIKELGINSVRFAKASPHPFALDICSELGLIAYVEIPLNSIPERFTEDETFTNRVMNFTSNFTSVYSQYPSVFAIGVGGGYLSNNNKILDFVNRMGKIVQSKSGKLSYASFSGIPSRELKDIDLFGVELFGESKPIKKFLLTTSISRNKIFISEVTYPNYNGSSSGYLNKFSIESQAKFFENIIDESKAEKLNGFFLNSMFDYSGDFSSLFAKYNEDNNYSIGILGNDRSINNLTYRVVKAKINSNKRITIPLGSSTDDAPIFFILSGLVLALMIGVLINSNKKFREDATRALLRPYNFYADIRDHRIISGLPTIILMIILSGAHALLLSNILFYFKNSVTFEKVLISFGLPSFISSVNYLAWHPERAFIFFSILGVIFILLLSWMIYIASFTLKIKIFFRNIFFTVVWAVLPLSILLPIKMVLYRILETHMINTYIYFFLGFYFLWIMQRIIKGIYVIFDINLSQAYFYFLLVAAVFVGGLVLYFQLNYSTIDFILQAIYQSQLI